MGNGKYALHPTSAIALSNFFIDKANAEKSVPTLDQIKLQKLLYFSYAWWAGLNESELYSEDVCVWSYGPVIPAVYEQTKRKGRAAIAEYLYKLNANGVKTQPQISEDNICYKFAGQIWEAYKKFTGVQLANLTHQEDEPWTLIYNKHNGAIERQPIPLELISRVYKKKL